MSPRLGRRIHTLMRNALRFGGIVLVAVGTVWVLQGMGFVGGSFMSGQTRWAIIGAVTALIGARLWIRSRQS